MHPNSAFRQHSAAAASDFARDRAFGMLSVNADPAPLIAHVPFLLEGDAADLHLVRSNPILRQLPTQAVLAVTGPDAYVSPDWYGVPDQVPTWNYVAVHLRGRLEALPQDGMRAMLDRQAAAYEARLAPKPPWTAGKMTPEVLDKLMRAITPCRLHVESIDSTFKLNQNKQAAQRLAAADGVADADFGSETARLAGLMRGEGE